MRDLGVTIGRLSLRFPCIATDTARSNAVPATDSLQARQGGQPPANIAPRLPLAWSRCLLAGLPAWMSPVAWRPATPALPACSHWRLAAPRLRRPRALVGGGAGYVLPVRSRRRDITCSMAGSPPQVSRPRGRCRGHAACCMSLPLCRPGSQVAGPPGLGRLPRALPTLRTRDHRRFLTYPFPPRALLWLSYCRAQGDSGSAPPDCVA